MNADPATIQAMNLETDQRCRCAGGPRRPSLSAPLGIGELVEIDSGLHAGLVGVVREVLRFPSGRVSVVIRIHGGGEDGVFVSADRADVDRVRFRSL